MKQSIILLSAIALALMSCKNEEGKITFDPEAVTQNSGNLEMFTATIYGKLVLPDIKPEDFTFGFEYSTDEAFSSSKSRKVQCVFYNTQNENMFSSVLSNLTMATQYYYRAYIIYKEVTYYGDVMTFTTKGVSVITGDMNPETYEVTSKVEMGTDFERVRYGLCFGPTSDITADNNSTIGTNEVQEDGSYTLALDNIPYGEFFYRAYVTMDGVTYYGEVKRLEGNKVVTGELDLENMTVSGWVRYYTGYDDFSYGICYGKSSAPTKDNDRFVTGGKFDSDNNFKATLERIPFGKVYYRAYIVIGQKVYYGDTYSFEHKMKIGEPVDMGLSVKWADINVGAVNDSDYGIYIAWAETEEKDISIRGNYKYGEGDPSDQYLQYALLKYNSDYSYAGVIDNKTVLEPMDDAASVYWGEYWRTPTQTEFKELVDNCVWTWTSKDGVNGYEVLSSVTGNSIFLPAGGGIFTGEEAWKGSAGCYWTSNVYDINPIYAYSYYLKKDEKSSQNFTRYSCLNVRAIYVK